MMSWCTPKKACTLTLLRDTIHVPAGVSSGQNTKQTFSCSKHAGEHTHRQDCMTALYTHAKVGKQKQSLCRMSLTNCTEVFLKHGHKLGAQTEDSVVLPSCTSWIQKHYQGYYLSGKDYNLPVLPYLMGIRNIAERLFQFAEPLSPQ